MSVQVHPWYIRPGTARWILLVLGLFWTISSPLRLIGGADTRDVILGVLNTLTGLAAVVSVLLSMKFDRDAASRPDSADDSPQPPSG